MEGGLQTAGWMDGEGYAECPLCGKDFFVIVSIRDDVIRAAEPDPDKKPYIPDSSPAKPQKIPPRKRPKRNLSQRIEIDWVEIPAGEFIFGLSESQAEDLMHNLPPHLKPGGDLQHWNKRLRAAVYREVPQRTIWMETFYISRYPITLEHYLPFATSDHRYAPSSMFTGEKLEHYLENRLNAIETLGAHPVSTSWHFAMAFCDWIGARLPTFAEWEKAARGVDGRLYPWGNAWDGTRGNFTIDRDRWPHKTSPVDAYPSGQRFFGILDMMGNAYEWTLSTIAQESELAVCRGSSCDFNAQMDKKYNPTWFRNRVTAFLCSPMNFGGTPDSISFRPVMSEWHRRAWVGF